MQIKCDFSTEHWTIDKLQAMMDAAEQFTHGGYPLEILGN